ncbi:CoB--CoM heterodisulfide reductase iron-sulfur subunit A [uncultured archaeon]|nr:CoB--CoM heterodisulfide reductase iron-sulfur subunit A [uncultured archaeon]
MRKIIKIDESLCNGCQKCMTSCAEGAIEMVQGKAKVVSDSFCDGLGACLAVCPTGALTLEEREAEDYDEKAVREHQRNTNRCRADEIITPCTAPVSLKPVLGREDNSAASKQQEEKEEIDSFKGEHNQLCGWPIQMRLVRSWAPYLKGAKLLVAGDCTAFAYPAIQHDFIRGRVALVGCPKLDESEPFVSKLAEILRDNEISDITVLHMIVPCCAKLDDLVTEALMRSGKKVPQKSYVVGIDGSIESGALNLE